MAFIPQYYPNMYKGGYHSMYNPRWNLGNYQFGGNMGDFFNYFKDLYPTLKGFQGQSAGQSNLYSDEAQKYYNDLISGNSAYDNYTNKDAYFQDNPYDPLGGVSIGNWQSEGVPGYYEAMNTNFDQQQSKLDQAAERSDNSKYQRRIAEEQAALDAKRAEWDSKTGDVFNQAKSERMLETGANIFSLMRGQEAYNQRAPEQKINIQNTGHQGFKYKLGGKPFNNLINTTGYTRGANTFNNPFNIIPGGNITMKNVDEPILAMPSNSRPMVMEPGKDYNFPGASYVVEQRLNTMKNGGKTKMYQLGGAGIQGNVQRAMFNNRFRNNPPPQLAQGFFNPFISVPQSDLNNRLYIQQMAGSQTQPTVAPVPVVPRITGVVPSYAMNKQGYIDGLEIMYNNNPANADDQIARSRYKDNGTKDKRFKKHYTKGYGNQVQTLGLSNRDQVKEIQRAMGMAGKEVDGVWGPKTQMQFDMWNTANMPSDAYVLPETPVDANGVPTSTLQPTVTDQYGNVATKPDLTPEQQAMWDYNFDRTLGIAGSSLLDGLSAGYVTKNPYVGAGVGLLSAAEQGLIGTDVIGSAANLAAMGKMGMGAARVAGKAIPKGAKLASGLYQGTKQGLVTLSKNDKKQFVDKGKYLIDETGAVFTKAGKKIKNGTAASKRAVADFFKRGKSVKVQDYEKSFTGQGDLSYGLYRDAKGKIQKIKDTRGGLQKILEGDFKNPFRGAKGYKGKPKQRSSNPTNYATFFRYGGEVTFENPFK